MESIRGLSWRWIRLLGLSLLLVLGSFSTWRACAHETDNFYLPLDVELVDFGDFLGVVHTRAIEEAVAEVNAEIDRALATKDPALRARRLERWQDPDKIAAAVVKQFGDAFTETYRAERTLSGRWVKQVYPGQQAVNSGIKMNLAGHFFLDPRALVMLSQANTIKAFGVYFGADKLTHFHQVGWTYYKTYRSLRREGLSHEEAYAKVLHRQSKTAFLSETHIFGTVGTGVYSNGDMAANHMGFKFFLNLTEPVVLKARKRESLVVRIGDHWQVNHQVRPQTGWLANFFSDHWNEALNPSLYDWTMRPRIRRVLQSRADHIVQFYTLKVGSPNDAVYFENVARQLATYYGEEYGHSGQFDKLMNIGNTCYPALKNEGKKSYETPALTSVKGSGEATAGKGEAAR